MELTQEKQRTANSSYPKGGVSCSKDSLVVNGSLVFQIKFCGEIPALRLAAKRCASFYQEILLKIKFIDSKSFITFVSG